MTNKETDSPMVRYFIDLEFVFVQLELRAECWHCNANVRVQQHQHNLGFLLKVASPG